MKIIVTGAGGFVGRALVSQLNEHNVIAVDYIASNIPKLSNVTAIAGDLVDPKVLSKATAQGCDVIVHLATVPGGAAEQDPARAWRINMDATMELASAVSASGSRPRFVFASSIAVLGDALPAQVNDETPLLPTSLYGGHKVMMEKWLAMLSRRDAIDAISLRLSGVVARPMGPSGMQSAFMSNIFHALQAGDKIRIPVSPQATIWLTSLDVAVANFAQALTAELDGAPAIRAVTLPTLRVQMSDLVKEICNQTGSSPNLVSYVPERPLEAAFGNWPPVNTPAAQSMGFQNDESIGDLVSRALASL